MSRSRSRLSSSTGPDLSRSTTTDNILLPDGPVSEESVQLLHEFVHPHHDREETLVGDDSTQDEEEEEREHTKRLPWWKRPSPLWLLAIIPITSAAMSSTLAPRVEIYTDLACAQHKPEIADNHTRFIPYPTSPLLSNPISNISITAHNNAGQLPGSIEMPTKKPSNPCKTDPVVQAAVAQLAAVMTACMGILSCITTGWWTSFSDRHGRTAALGISVFGILITDATFILVYFFSQSLPGGYWFLVLGPLIEGSMGGFTTAAATFHAYMADTTTAASRSRMFSLNLGLMFIGFALGPTLGGLLIRTTQQTISVFYVATLVHMLYAFMIWFIVPESNGKRKMQLARAKYQEETLELRRSREGAGILLRIKRLFSFLTPLVIFNPIPVSDNPLKPPRRDWNLVLIALSYAFTVSVIGSVTYKFQYAASAFDWSSETLGYWLSLVGAARAFHLAVVLPICIRLFKPTPRKASSEESEPLISPTSSHTPSASTAPSSRASSHSPSRLLEPHSSAFDLGLARVSLSIEIVAYLFMALATTPLAFAVFGMLGSFGSGFSPAIQSVALEMYMERGGTENGKLFGALSVVQALSSQIIGPAMYGLVYMKTVAVFPRTIFFVSVGSTVVSFVFLSLVRLPRRNVAGHNRERTLVADE
ncbi:major facilitator superfamily domain-containing protein [Lentinula raphanica]|uniref:Major facilitator superfamily domain-containing protein n=1 Tax=Lentinula raphanica TaxID=153919 RepID=A0AA38UFA8_9AGAR|nr:major facilitator superfamily domain-containing protein [Lentinula raphanica]KAJ3839667.1 major facilitator superfamily domain-containing protein [Lentinula raphanica]KAJ3965355.1 major facilitator superfamily domain-containing protein [Lentinula raphanica]